MRHGLIHIEVLELDVLVEGALGAIGLLAGLHRTPVVSLYFAGGAPEALLLVVFVAAAVLDLLCLFLG